MAVRSVPLVAWLLLSWAVPGHADASGYLRPETFGFSELVSKDFQYFARLEQALARQGIIAVEMGTDFAKLRANVLADASRCMDALDNMQAAVATVKLPDRTSRRTLAGESNVDGNRELKAIFSTASAPEECLQFELGCNKFRLAVAEVVDAFGERLAQVVVSFSTRFHVPELKYGPGGNASSSDGRGPFAELTRRGPRLEHFHAYERDRDSAVNEMRMLSAQTIDFHADQGLFVVFSPGMMLPQTGLAASSAAAGRFMVRSADYEGSILARDLDVGPHEGSKLVILLGDAVRQLGIPHVERLFHVPLHAFRMPSDGSSVQLRRIWYGLMQLPPPTLVAQGVVDQATQQKLTFGEIRVRVAASAGAEGGMALGCSPVAQQLGSSGSPRRLVPRLLEDVATCESSSIYCWHRCMELPDMTEAQCQERGDGFRFACVSQFDQVYRQQDGHGDYWPMCTNATEYVTPRPAVEQPSGDSAASDATWATLTTVGAPGNEAFSHKIVLHQPVGNTVLLWALDSSSGDATYLNAKMLHRGHVGWMAFGLENVGGAHNGMNGGHVVMGKNDPDLPQAEGGPLQVGEYQIHPVMTAHRHWQTPLAVSDPGSVSLVSSSFSVENGISILEFQTAGIYSTPLNLSAPADSTTDSDSGGHGSNAVNRFIWGLTENAYCTAEYGGYCAYHADATSDQERREEFRGKVRLDLTTGDVLPLEDETPLDSSGDHNEHNHGGISTTNFDGHDVSACRLATSLASVLVASLLVVQ